VLMFAQSKLIFQKSWSIYELEPLRQKVPQANFF
jgi:hypothetical protein